MFVVLFSCFLCAFYARDDLLTFCLKVIIEQVSGVILKLS